MQKWKWEPAEDEYLRENYKNGGWDEMSRHLGRTKKAIQRRGPQLGLKRKYTKEQAPMPKLKLRWTDRERQEAFDKYSQGDSFVKLAKQYNTTKGDIKEVIEAEESKIRFKKRVNKTYLIDKFDLYLGKRFVIDKNIVDKNTILDKKSG